MTDPLVDLVSTDITSVDLTSVGDGKTGSALLVADENCSEALLDSLPTHIQILTNRWGLYQHALDCGLTAYFNDFDFSVLTSPPRIIYYRISKEKAVTHHVINQSFSVLPVGGQFILWGEKKAGVKTYIKKTNALFDDVVSAKKSGKDYVAIWEKTAPQDSALADHSLDDSDYPRLRAEISFGDKALFTKPGLFGWDKVDRGSALLIEHLDNFFAGFKTRPENLLDLGCGYGLLTAAAASRGISQVTAVDNCAAALLACEKNILEPCQALYKAAIAGAMDGESEIKIFKGRVIAADCRAAYAENFSQQINEKFDVVLCNPPFHQGFDTERELTEAFLATAARQLKPGGQALFVTNRFIALEKTAAGFFNQASTLAENREFRLTVMQNVKK
ncbi:MAG: class I SAM-dependent methyltransferase [Porticoccaceae bacterium]|nr:class I SAM-dependent methyltransferase [Porticoccaceae bacterium]